jgi:murein DD-endopeptidase MepM/ murein hydrolase activator NlpD
MALRNFVTGLLLVAAPASPVLAACPPGLSMNDVSAVTDLSRTYIRQNQGEFGAARKNGPHTGVDILTRASYEDPEAYAVYSVADGTIAYARFNGKDIDDGFGNTIVVDHGGDCYSMYAHLASDPFTPIDQSGALMVSLGQDVSKGELIGYFVDQAAGVESTGNAMVTTAGARWQTHFELWDVPSGRTSTGKLEAIYADSANRVDPTSLLLDLGYAVEGSP